MLVTLGRAALRKVLRPHWFSTDVERAVRAGRLPRGRPGLELSAARWASYDVAVPGLASMHEDQGRTQVSSPTLGAVFAPARPRPHRPLSAFRRVEQQPANRFGLTDNPNMASFSGVSRRVVALTVAGVLLVLVALGYLLLRAQVANRIEGDEQAYEKWVDGFAAGLGDRAAVVILEPDALGQLNSCLDKGQQQSRLRMLSYAVRTLQTKSNQVYLDAGHSNWVPAGQMAARLRAAGVVHAHGFALNVSNYSATAGEIGYATELNRKLGMAKRFVVDTSRNGKGSAGGGVPPSAGTSPRTLPSADGRGLTNELFTDPDAQAANWVRTHPGDPRAPEIEQRIANQPAGKWFGPWSGDITAAVRGYTLAAAKQHEVPVLVAYNIPHRDCGGSLATGRKQWCNPPGKQLGSVPRVLDDRGDMGLWIKAPGESDGDCGLGAGTQPGEFSPRIATALITGRPTASREDNP